MSTLTARRLLWAALALALAGSCARRPYWTGFGQPAYLPAHPKPTAK